MIKSMKNQIRPVILGKVKIGKWLKGKSGQKFDHFKIVKMGRTQDGDIIEDAETTDYIRKLVGLKEDQKITRIPIYFSANTMAEVFDCWYSLRWGSKTLCRGDGSIAERANISIDGGPPQNGALKIKQGQPFEILGSVTVPCADSKEGCPYYNPKPENKSYCLMGAKLLFHIQGLTRRGGYFAFSTHSVHSTRNLYSGLMQFEKMLCGHLSFLPFELVIEPQRNMKNQLIYVVHLEMVGDMQELRTKAIEAASVEMQFLKQMKQIRDEGVKLLEMKTEDISEEDGEEETKEFYEANKEIPEIKEAKTFIATYEEKEKEEQLPDLESNDNNKSEVGFQSGPPQENPQEQAPDNKEKDEEDEVEENEENKNRPPDGMLF